MNCDAVVMKSKLCTIDELIKNRLMDAHLNSVEEEESEKVIPSFFKDALDYTETLRTLFVFIMIVRKLSRDLTRG